MKLQNCGPLDVYKPGVNQQLLPATSKRFRFGVDGERERETQREREIEAASVD